MRPKAPIYWNEFIFLAYHHFQHDAVFLSGVQIGLRTVTFPGQMSHQFREAGRSSMSFPAFHLCLAEVGYR
jgi:hypothetical protein